MIQIAVVQAVAVQAVIHQPQAAQNQLHQRMITGAKIKEFANSDILFISLVQVACCSLRSAWVLILTF